MYLLVVVGYHFVIYSNGIIHRYTDRLDGSVSSLHDLRFPQEANFQSILYLYQVRVYRGGSPLDGYAISILRFILSSRIPKNYKRTFKNREIINFLLFAFKDNAISSKVLLYRFIEK